MHGLTYAELAVEHDRCKAEIERLKVQVMERDAAVAGWIKRVDELRAALKELLSGHDNLYIAHFGPQSDPHDDIAAKAARSIIEQ